VVTLSGSLPPGLPLDAYADLIALARRADVPTVLDTSGPALRTGLRARPTIVKPNAAELADLLTEPAANALRPSESDEDLVALVRDLGAEVVVVSRGERGLLAVHGAHSWAAAPPERIDGNPTGAGDACVAALARGLRDRIGWPELLADAVALSAAAVAVPIAGAFDVDLYRRIRPLVQAEPRARHPAPPEPAGSARPLLTADPISTPRRPATAGPIKGEMSCS
jgi:tagatose 6-phosphate kinase